VPDWPWTENRGKVVKRRQQPIIRGLPAGHFGPHCLRIRTVSTLKQHQYRTSISLHNPLGYPAAPPPCLRAKSRLGLAAKSQGQRRFATLGAATRPTQRWAGPLSPTGRGVKVNLPASAQCRAVDHRLYEQTSANSASLARRRREGGRRGHGLRILERASRETERHVPTLQGRHLWLSCLGTQVGEAARLLHERSLARSRGIRPWHQGRHLQLRHARKHSQAAAPGSAPPAELLERSKELRMRPTSWSRTFTRLHSHRGKERITWFS
jgi:hypothetical protein